MKQVIIALSVGLLCLPVGAQQVKDKTNSVYGYKCHLELSDKRQVIRDYRNQPKNQNANLERMLRNEQVAVERGTRLAITQVFECVERDGEFSKAVARELDRNTLR
jgi:hypothetical protein